MDDARNPIAAAHRVDAQENGNLALLNAVHEELWIMRLTGALNLVATAMTHADERDWTTTHARRVLDVLRVTDAVAANADPGIVPSGFGSLVRANGTAAICRALAKNGEVK